MKNKLKKLLDPYDNCALECDGFSRIASYLLTQNNIPHDCFVGHVEFEGRIVAPHFWIVVGKWTVDYRLRMWLGPTAPHGVFVANNSIKYVPPFGGGTTNLNCTKLIFEILTGRTDGT